MPQFGERLQTDIDHFRDRVFTDPTEVLDPETRHHEFVSGNHDFFRTALTFGHRNIVDSETGQAIPNAQTAFECGESGTVARFGTALAAIGDRETRIDGAPRLRERPMAPLVDALRALGATIDRDALPLTVSGPLRGGEVSVSGVESS